MTKTKRLTQKIFLGIALFYLVSCIPGSLLGYDLISSGACISEGIFSAFIYTIIFTSCVVIPIGIFHTIRYIVVKKKIKNVR